MKECSEAEGTCEELFPRSRRSLEVGLWGINKNHFGGVLLGAVVRSAVGGGLGLGEREEASAHDHVWV